MSSTNSRPLHRRPGAWLRSAFAALALFAASAAGAAVQPLTVEDMAAVADDVVTVRVEDNAYEWYEGRLITRTRVQVVESFKGTLSGTQTLTTLGGKWKGMVMDVPDLPKFAVGEEAVLFLRKPAQDAAGRAAGTVDLNSPLILSPQVVGGFQGKLNLLSPSDSVERTAGQGVPAAAKVARMKSGEVVPGVKEAPTYGEFRGALQELAAATAARSGEFVERRIAGVQGTVQVPKRSETSVFRKFDPLPALGYMSDEQLARERAKHAAGPKQTGTPKPSAENSHAGERQ